MFRLYLIASLGVLFVMALGSSLMVPLDDRYYVSEYNATFVHALAECKMIGMDLLRINSAAEGDTLYTLMNTTGLTPGRSFWMGGIHLNVGTWVWIETGTLLNYTRWGANEPNLTTGEDYCLQLGKDNDGLSPRNWESKLCSTERYYICQTK